MFIILYIIYLANHHYGLRFRLCIYLHNATWCNTACRLMLDQCFISDIRVSFIYIYSTEHHVITEILFYMALTTHNHTLMKIVTDKSIIYECIASCHWVLMTMHAVQSIELSVLGLPLWYLQTILLWPLHTRDGESLAVDHSR